MTNKAIADIKIQIETEFQEAMKTFAEKMLKGSTLHTYLNEAVDKSLTFKLEHTVADLVDKKIQEAMGRIKFSVSKA